MNPWAVVWLVWGLFGAGIEAYNLHLKNHSGTLSQTLQRQFLTHGKAIRQVTWASWLAFSFWFAYHIWGI